MSDDKEMRKALEADGEKLRQLTGEDHGPWEVEERFHVYQFFVNGKYERVREFVGAKEAVEAARHYTSSLAVAFKVIDRVIITDMGDNCVFEWKAGEGITFPPEAKGRQ